MFRIIGETAGEIWKLLKDEEALSISTIAKKLDQPQNRVYMGLGWLAREDKVLFNQTKLGIHVSLKK